MNIGTHKPQTPILDVRNLVIAYETRKGDVNAVRDVSFQINRAETVGIVGESGCGKSTVAFGIVNFLGRNGRIVDGQIMFQGQDLVGRSPEELRRIRGDRIAMVYQDPMQALNPSMRIGDQMSEVLIVHRQMKKAAAEAKCVQMLDQVKMPDPASVMQRFPHQISGGQQQRVVIATALLNDPALLIMDEPTTALDVTVEAAVLDLVGELQREFDTAIMYISHNLGVIARVSDRLAVMYAGEMVERGAVRDVFLRPFHPYTQGLLRCVPRLGMDKRSSFLYPIPGRVPSPKNLPPGCVFEPRCSFSRPECSQRPPELREVEPGHWARCLFAQEIRQQGWQPPADILESLVAPAEAKEKAPILQVDHAKTYYEVPSTQLFDRKKLYVKAVDDVSIQVKPGQTLGIVGESGCGKSTLVKTIIGMEPPTGGEFEFMGVDISNPVSKRGMEIISNLQMVFQNPELDAQPLVHGWAADCPAAAPLQYGTLRSGPPGGDSPVGDDEAGRALLRPAATPAKRRRKAAGRYCACHRRPAGIGALRRAGFCAGRLGPGGRAQPADGNPERVGHHDDLYCPRFERGPLFLRPHCGDVPGPDCRDWPGRGDLCAALSPLHRGVALGRADSGPVGRAEAHPPGGQRAQRAAPAGRLPFPHPLPAPQPATGWRPGLRERDAALARGRQRSPDLLSHPTGRVAADGSGGHHARDALVGCKEKCDMFVKDYMTRHPLIAEPTMPVLEAQRFMGENKVRHLPVVGDGKRLLGLVSRQSLMVDPGKLGSFNLWEIASYMSDLRVQDVMVKAENVFTVQPNATLEEATHIMVDHRVGCLPVMENNVVVGIITEIDMLVHLSNLLGGHVHGVRATIRVPDRIGEYAKITNAVASRGWGIYASGSVQSPKNPESWDVVIKVRNVPKELLAAALMSVEEQELIDIRETS